MVKAALHHTPVVEVRGRMCTRDPRHLPYKIPRRLAEGTTGLEAEWDELVWAL